MPMNRCFPRPGWRSIRLTARHFCAVVLVAASATAVSAQEYKTDTVDAEAARLGGLVRQCIRDPARYSADRAKFADFFTKAYFPLMTRTGPEELARLGDMRYKLFKDYLWGTNNEQLQSDLTALTFSAMGGIVTAQNPPYHPAVRYNAVLVMGMLDEQYPREGATARPSKPFPRATRALTVIVDSATTGNRFSPPVILGAVIGLERHAQFRNALTPDAVQAMTAALLKLVSHAQPIQEMDRETYAWLRVRAASALALLGSPGSNNSVHDAILKLVADLKSLDDRCAAAAMLNKLDYKEVKLEPATTTEPLFGLARDLGAAEAERAQKFQEERLAGGGFAPSVRGEGGYYGGGVGAYGEQQEQFPRRHVLARLMDLRSGLQAVRPAVPADAQTKIDAVLAAIKPVITSAADKDTGELKFTGDLRDMVEAINRAVPPPQAAAAETEEETF